MNPNLGQQHVAGAGGNAALQVLNLSASSQRQLDKHQAVLLDLEAQKVAATIDVPTLPDQVRAALRELGQPVRLFGENLANVRDRLRLELARRRVAAGGISAEDQDRVRVKQQLKEEEEEEQEVTQYTRASPALVEARQAIAKFSLERAKARLARERQLRAAALQQRNSKRARAHDRDDYDETKKDAALLATLEELDRTGAQTFRRIQQDLALEGSQYGDSRALSCLATQYIRGSTTSTPLVATGSWTGTLQLWDGGSPDLHKLGEQTNCHEDRIMGLAMQTGVPDDNDESALICTTSIDLTAKLWKARKNDVVMADVDNEEEEEAETSKWTITEQAHLKGHAARLCRTAFHPMKRHVATTSFDHTWRLWDIETNQECLLLQDGHWKEVYGVGFHPDGSLCATTDFAGVVQVWDLRSGKAIRHFLGHAKRVLNAEFHPTTGFQMATAGDDGTIKIWDLRRRKMATSIPAHSNIVTGLRFDPDNGEYLASCSFDGTVKLWNCRNWKMLNSLQGHEGKVSGVDVVHGRADAPISLVSCGFDKTLKMWR